MLCPFQRTRDTRRSSTWLTPLHHQSLHPSNWFIWLWDGSQDPHTRAGILFIGVSPLAGERVQWTARQLCAVVTLTGLLVYIMTSVTYRCTSVSLSLTCSFFQLYSCSVYILISCTYTVCTVCCCVLFSTKYCLTLSLPMSYICGAACKARKR
jgi:hypothetical protein